MRSYSVICAYLCFSTFFVIHSVIAQNLEPFPGDQSFSEILKEDDITGSTPRVLVENLQASRALDVPRMYQRQPFVQEGVGSEREVVWLKETEDEAIFAFLGEEIDHGILLAIFTAGREESAGPEEAPVWRVRDMVRRYGIGNSQLLEESLRLVTSQNAEGEEEDFVIYSLYLGSSWTARMISEIWRVTEKLNLQPAFTGRTGYFDRSDGPGITLIEQTPRIEPGETLKGWGILLDRRIVREEEVDPEDVDLRDDEVAEDAETAEEPVLEEVVEESQPTVKLLWDGRTGDFIPEEPKKLRLMDVDLED
jgi:hypothetical protein